MKHIKPHLNFKQDFWKTILVDLLMYVSIFLSARLWSIYAVNIFSGISVDEISAMTNIMNNSKDLTYAWNHFLVSMVILFLVAIIIWSFFKNIVWNIILKKKFNLDTFKRFTFLNIFWVLISSTALILAAYPYLTTGIALSTARWIITIAVVFLIIYLTNIFYIFYIEEPKYKSIRLAINFAYKHLLHMLPVYAIVYLIFIFASFIGSFYALLSGFMFIFVTAWARVYVNNAVEILK